MIRARALKRVVELTASGRILYGNQRISMLKHGIVFSNPLNATSASLHVERNEPDLPTPTPEISILLSAHSF